MAAWKATLPPREIADRQILKPHIAFAAGVKLQGDPAIKGFGLRVGEIDHRDPIEDADHVIAFHLHEHVVPIRGPNHVLEFRGRPRDPAAVVAIQAADMVILGAVKCEDDGNSGIYFHTRFKPGTVDVASGMQFEIDRTANHHVGGLYGDDRGWIAWPSPEYEYVMRPTDWNDMLMKVEGNHMICILNGITVIDFTDPKPKSFDGGIALQLHSGGEGNMRFKDLAVRDLSRR